MNASPRVVLGLPAFARPDSLPRALESLLSQTYQDFALVVVDDAPDAKVAPIVDRYAREYPRITYAANPARLGMVGNWRRVFEEGRTRYPGSDYFAWVSDHDVWHARWLETLVSVLDQEPSVVVAYSASLRTTSDDAWLEKKGFDTAGIRRASTRIARAAEQMLAGDMIYGLIRARTLEAAGVFHHVVTPDRQVLLALSLFGGIRHVPEVLWYREMERDFDLERQRKVFFPDGTPLYAYFPSHLQHCASLLWDFGIRGKGRPQFGRLVGASYAAVHLWFSVARQLPRLRRRARPS
ncbi:MAG TPA: glycosyltransferase family 2 protein [Vicinamibacterales bacterium]|nr:glycosyltransferase family 2 protein [Vicinamibacterales bacterium]